MKEYGVCGTGEGINATDTLGKRNQGVRKSKSAGKEVEVKVRNEKSRRPATTPQFVSLQGCFGNSDPTQIAHRLSVTVT
jgi:hypothetical protein